MDLDANTIIGIAIGYIVAEGLAQLRRYLARTRFWKGIERTAGESLRDPAIPIDDARQAAERALVDAQRAKVAEVARAISLPSE